MIWIMYVFTTTGKSQGTLSQPTTCSSPYLRSSSSSSTLVGSTSPRPWSTPLARTMRTLTSTTSSTGPSTESTPHNQINHQIDSSIEITVETELYLCAKQRTCTSLHLIFPSKLHGSQNLWAQEPPDQLLDGWGRRWRGGARRPLPRRPSHLYSCKMSALVHTIFARKIFLRALKAHWGSQT